MNISGILLLIENHSLRDVFYTRYPFIVVFFYENLSYFDHIQSRLANLKYDTLALKGIKLQISNLNMT